jgi:hypothetical protein
VEEDLLGSRKAFNSCGKGGVRFSIFIRILQVLNKLVIENTGSIGRNLERLHGNPSPGTSQSISEIEYVSCTLSKLQRGVSAESVVAGSKFEVRIWGLPNPS